jgi:flagellin
MAADAIGGGAKSVDHLAVHARGTVAASGAAEVSTHTWGSDLVAAGDTLELTLEGVTYEQAFTTSSANTMILLATKISENSAVTAVGTSATVITITGAVVNDAIEQGVLTVTASASTKLDASTLTTVALANSSITSVDAALATVDSYRSVLGAASNTLNHSVNNLMNRSENQAAAQSRIEDTDYAVESANLAKSQVLQQAGTAMLAQANASGQSVLSLLK